VMVHAFNASGFYGCAGSKGAMECESV
jgi:hypothetical protein